MKNRLLAQLPAHKACICSIYNPHLYIIDWKDYNGGIVEISGAKRDFINAVHLLNNNNVEVLFDGFSENALPVKKGKCSKQCECILFPNNYSSEEDWVLFIETKYAKNIMAAQNSDRRYPYCMVQQIKETVLYFRRKGIISEDKVVHAIISFPNLIAEFNSWVFPILHDGVEESILDILNNDNIIIRATNTASIIDERRLFLNSDI